MTANPQTGGELITDKRQLVAALEAGSKPVSAWRIGTEHEKFAFCRRTLRRLDYGQDGGVHESL